jgi:hypothetical protein
MAVSRTLEAAEQEADRPSRATAAMAAMAVYTAAAEEEVVPLLLGTHREKVEMGPTELSLL